MSLIGSYAKKGAAIICGSVFISAGVNWFLVPYKVLDGGMIGIALILNYLWDVQIGLTIIGCSIPVFYIAWKWYRPLFYNSLHGMLVSSFFIDLLKPMMTLLAKNYPMPPVWSAMTGGLMIGIGIGLMLRQQTSTGGTDLLAQLLSDILSINVGVFIFLIDGLIISFGGLVISSDTFLLSLLTITSGGFATSICTMHIYKENE